MQLFGTAGIRGITNRDITPELGVLVGKAYGSIFRGNIAVARDNRYGAEMIAHSVIAGLQATGNTVYDLGITPLPAFAKFVSEFMDGGIIITGSHTPPEIVGIVAVDSLGRDLYWDTSKEIEDRYQKRDFVLDEWNNVKDTKSEDAIEHYTRFIEKKAKNIEGFHVLMDMANGTGAGIMNIILENLGVKVDCINCNRSSIPNRPSEPRVNTVREMIKKSKNYDLGMAVDVDADRVVFARGEFISEDVTGAIFATRFAKKMVTPINSSSLVNYISKEYGIEVFYCPIGPPEIAEAIIRTNADFGYEETGKYVFPPDTLWGDSLLSTVTMLNIMNREGKSINELASEFPKFYQVKEKLKVHREKKRAIVKKVMDYFESHFDNYDELVKIDGVKIVYEDAWLLIRASGTEDVIRIFSDAKSEKRAKELVKLGKEIVMKFM